MVNGLNGLVVSEANLRNGFNPFNPLHPLTDWILERKRRVNVFIGLRRLQAEMCRHLVQSGAGVFLFRTCRGAPPGVFTFR